MSVAESASMLAFFLAFPAMAWGVVHDEKYPAWVNTVTFAVFVGPVITCLIVSALYRVGVHQ